MIVVNMILVECGLMNDLFVCVQFDVGMEWCNLCVVCECFDCVFVYFWVGIGYVVVFDDCECGNLLYVVDVIWIMFVDVCVEIDVFDVWLFVFCMVCDIQYVQVCLFWVVDMVLLLIDGVMIDMVMCDLCMLGVILFVWLLSDLWEYVGCMGLLFVVLMFVWQVFGCMQFVEIMLMCGCIEQLCVLIDGVFGVWFDDVDVVCEYVQFNVVFDCYLLLFVDVIVVNGWIGVYVMSVGDFLRMIVLYFGLCEWLCDCVIDVVWCCVVLDWNIVWIKVVVLVCVIVFSVVILLLFVCGMQWLLLMLFDVFGCWIVVFSDGDMMFVVMLSGVGFEFVCIDQVLEILCYVYVCCDMFECQCNDMLMLFLYDMCVLLMLLIILIDVQEYCVNDVLIKW